jgi:hypothetical protein
MGVHIPNLDFLLKFRGRALGDTLLLGRQGFHIPLAEGHPQRLAGQRLLSRYDPAARLEQLTDESGYCEPLFRYLGATSVRSMDASAYEGADLVHDLNVPVPPELHDRFDCIFDGGTTEHIFDIPAVFRNVGAMLRMGGLFLMSNGANNFLGHGFYQFSPELLWRAFSLANGFQVELMQLVDESDAPQPMHVADPGVTGRREEIRTTNGCTLLLMAARKVRLTTAAPVQQSDYQAAWHHNGA